MSNQSTVLRVLGAIWRGLDRLRRFLHLILVLGVFLFLLIVVTPQPTVVPASAALVIAPQGAIVDQLSGDPFERALARAQGLELGESLLKDMIDAVRSAAEDERIKALVLQPDGLTAAGLSKLAELAREIERFRETGKPVFAVGSAYDRDQYYLAAQADEVFIHPMGLVLVDGYSSFVPYYKSALDKLYIDYNVWTVGEYKSFVEPVTRDDMSPEDREARSRFLREMWRVYQDDVVAARGLEANALQRYADEFVALLRNAGGNSSELALDYGLVDQVIEFDEMAARIREVAGDAENGNDGYSAIGHSDYLSALEATQFPAAADARIAVVVAAGTILDGTQPPGTVGADSTARLIREARQDESVRALVLRVDSPGGSAFASDVILRELELFRETEKPFVVSMGSVAASGGYWIAMSADEIWASPATLTGSIGVGATFPTFQRTLAELGINIDGVGTTRLAGQMSPFMGVGEDISEYIALSIQQTYDEFTSKVATYRDMDPGEVEAAAQGRVWIGTDALDRGLVDELGGIDAAIESAAELAGIAGGDYEVIYLEPELGLVEQLALEFVHAAAPIVGLAGFEPRLPAALASLLEMLSEPLAFVERLNDPLGIYAYCFCDVR